ncbi:hypothetical protein HGRIS_003062 [Hohenbuehelia grisea]
MDAHLVSLLSQALSNATFMPNLQSLRVYYRPRTEDEGQQAVMLDSLLTKLRIGESLHEVYCDVFDNFGPKILITVANFPALNLRALRASFSGLHVALSVLRDAQLLESCVLSFQDSNWSAGQKSKLKVTLPNLRFLQLVNGVCLLDCLVAPALRFLKTPQLLMGCRSVIKFCRRSLCPLNTLILDYLHDDATEFLNLLRSVPTVRYLSMRSLDPDMINEEVAEAVSIPLLPPTRSFRFSITSSLNRLLCPVARHCCWLSRSEASSQGPRSLTYGFTSKAIIARESSPDTSLRALFELCSASLLRNHTHAPNMKKTFQKRL